MGVREWYIVLSKQHTSLKQLCEGVTEQPEKGQTSDAPWHANS